MKKNKEQTTAQILSLIEGNIVPCTKKRLDNILFPKWSDMGLFGQIISQTVKTKEQPNGCPYDEMRFQVVMRILGGKVLMTGGRPDAYAWGAEQVEKILSSAKPIGVNSAAGAIAFAETLSTITDLEEEMLFADMFCNWKKDLLLVTTPAEKRQCVEVTKELYDAGLTFCVDEWMKPNDNGEAEETILNVGDFLIISPKGSVYCIRRDEFFETHSLI